MLGNRPPQFQPRPYSRPPIGFHGPMSTIEHQWKSLWPYRISTILGGLIIFFGVVIFVLEIALLGIIGDVVNAGVYSTGVGIWTGFFIITAGVLMLLINWMKSTRLWTLIAFVGAIVATAFSIIEFSINARRVHLARLADIFSYSDSRIASLGGLPAAQLAFGIVLFLLCLAFIGLYLFTLMKIKRLRSGRR
ncbi:hypothetical protein I4U23_000139 [Adineta vaga]|nr:hypothetical protein I4U23_000139 [Adineta vaga]